MPVQETADAIAELTALGIPVGHIIVNSTRPQLLTDGKVTSADAKRALAAVGAPADAATMKLLTTEAKNYLVRTKLEADLKAELGDLGKPLVELPFLPDGVNRKGLDELARILREAGA